MKKQIHILEGIIILTVIFLAGLLSIKFIYKIRHEKLDTNYMWNISLNNLHIKEGSKDAKISLENNILNLDVVLKKEEEFYELTFDIENNGTLDAKLKSIDYQVSNPKNILTYSINYINGNNIKEDDILESQKKETILVRIYYPKQNKKIYDSLELKLSLTLEYTAIYK